MKKRQRMTRGDSRRTFRNSSGAKRLNYKTNPMRGGIRL